MILEGDAMITLLLAISIFLLAGLGLGLGVVFGRQQIKGSCGGCSQCLCERRSHE